MKLTIKPYEPFTHKALCETSFVAEILIIQIVLNLCIGGGLIIFYLERLEWKLIISFQLYIHSLIPNPNMMSRESRSESKVH
jgi:hypothetical protein